MAAYGGRVEEVDGAWAERAVEAELQEDDGTRGGRAASWPRKFTPCQYLLMASIALSYTCSCCGIVMWIASARACSIMANTS